MKIKYAPLLLCILYVINCNNSSPNPTPSRTDVAVSDTLINGIPLKYNRIWTGKVDSLTAQSWHSRGVDIYQDSVTAAIDYYEKAFLIRHQLNPNHWTTAKTVLNLGVAYSFKRDFVAAQTILEKALTIISQPPYLPIKEKLKGDIFAELGNVYMETTDIRHALKSYQESVSNYDAISSSKFDTMIVKDDYVVPYLGMLNYYKEVKQVDTFNYYLNKCKNFIDLSDTGNVIKYEIPQGSMYSKQGKYNESVAILKRVTQYAQDADLGGAYIELAKTYLAMKQLPQARESVEKGIQIWQSLGEKMSIRDLIEGYTLSGKIYEADGKKEKALDEYKKVTPNPGYGWISLEPLHRKALLTENKDTAFKYYKDLTDIIISIRYQLKREDEKMLWTGKTRVICEEALENAYDLYQKRVSQQDKTGEFQYLNRIINLFAQNKAILLSEEWSKMGAKQIAGVPDSLIRVEKQLYSALASVQNSNPAEVEKIYATFNAFQAELKQKYPNYYETKYGDLGSNELNIHEIQKKLEDKSCLLEYFWGKQLYALAINPKQYVLQSIPTDSLEDKIRMVRQFLGDSIAYKLSVPQKLTLAAGAYQLNARLVQPVLASFKGVKRLQIVKDSLLNLIAFETLLTDSLHHFKQEDAPLLLRKYAISYPFIHHPQHRTKTQIVDNQQYFGAITFNYESSVPQTFASSGTLGKVRPLHYLPQQITKASETFFPKQSKVWLNTANFSDMRSDFHKYRIFVLGMHAHASLNTPDSCVLQFADTTVKFAEILGLDGWKTQLLFLAACRTGEGRYAEGVGVMSLSYGFAFAGCQSIVESAWSVDETTTADILYSFLKYLKNGFAKDEALQQAKLDYLGKQSKDSDSLLPIFWAGLNLKGDISPIQMQAHAPYGFLVYILAGALLVWAVGIYRRYNK